MKPALAWDMGRQSAQALDEFSGYINSKSYASEIELDSEASEELWNLIKSQRWAFGYFRQHGRPFNSCPLD
jgi:hypothetical protein